MNTTKGDLPRGDQWSVFDALSWITFGEVRAATADFEFPRQDWSRDWKHWPPEWLAFAFQEVETGIPWQPDPDELGPFGPDNQRAWARRIIADTGESAGELLKVLMIDIDRYSANQNRWRRAKAELNEAVRRGKLRVWGIKAHAPSKPDHDGIHTLIDPLVFTETRAVDEASRVDWNTDCLGFINYRGPSYDQVFFDSAEVNEDWPTATKVKPGTLEWLTNAAEAFLKETRYKPKQADLVGDCVVALGCSFRGAKAAYKLLPDYLRRGRGERVFK